MVKWVVGAVLVIAVLFGAGFVYLQSQQTTVAAQVEVPEEAPAKRKVLMIPGYGGGKDQLQRLGKTLSQSGIEWEIVDVGNGEGDLTQYAKTVENRAKALKSQGYAVDLIGYSAGGVTARVAANDKPEDFRRIITIASPHDGTEWANLGAAFGACPEACQQLRPDSDLLAGLDPEEDDSWLSIYSETDEVIRPADSSRLSGAVIRPIQNACPDVVVDHGEMPDYPQTKAWVVAFLQNEDLSGLCVANPTQ